MISAPLPAAVGGSLVQLRGDTERSPEFGFATQHLDLPTALEPIQNVAQLADVLANLFAVLYRHTQQEDLAVDVYAATPWASLRRTLALPAHAAMTPRRAAELLLAQLERSESGAEDVPLGPASNVAVRLGCDQEAPAGSYEVELRLSAAADGTGKLVFNANLFHVPSMLRLISHLEVLQRSARANPDVGWGSLELLPPEELELLTGTWDSGSSAYSETVHERFTSWAKLRPEKLAIRCGSHALTYGQLDRLSNQLAHHLTALGVDNGSMVAVCVTPSIDVVIGMLAAFKAGATYVPLDPTHPPALVRTILDEVEPSVILTQSALRELACFAEAPQFFFDTDLGLLTSQPETAPNTQSGLSDAAYVLYTSGTTGRPKGVMALHRNLAHYTHVARVRYGFNEQDRFCSLARYTFSISMFELLSPLICGGSLTLLTRDEVLAPDRLVRYLQDVTVLHAGPSLLASLFRYIDGNPAAPRTLPRMRHASSGGDLVPPNLLEDMKRVFPSAELFVIYGCTEISCMGVTYEVQRDVRIDRNFVGYAFPNMTVRVLDAELNLCPLGAVGEICFAGDGVVPGYFNRDALNEEKFVWTQGQRFYKTGDLGRLHPDGTLEILGRRDFQVQVHGIRIELNGIENTIRDLGLAGQCAVAVRRTKAGDPRLVAFLVDATVKAVRDLRVELSKQLPDYMLPQSMLVVDALPLTHNGKLDRRGLLDLPWEEAGSSDAGTAPRNAVEKCLAEAFASVLGRDEVSIDDDFFELGGDSLLLVGVIEQLKNTLGLSLSPGALFEHTTVRALAEYASKSFDEETKPVLLSSTDGAPALFMVAGVHLYRELTRRLEGEFSVYGVYAGRELLMFEEGARPITVEDLASEYVTIIRRHQPRGPYNLGGMSFGGVVAFEVAQQLRAAGETVSFLALLDSTLPTRVVGTVRSLAGRFWTLSPAERGKAALAFAKLCAREALGIRRRYTEFVREHDDERAQALEDKRQTAYRKASLAYLEKISAYPGRMLLLTAGKRLAQDPLADPECGWKRYARSLVIERFDTDHLGLLEHPAVDKVARAFLQGRDGVTSAARAVATDDETKMFVAQPLEAE